MLRLGYVKSMLRLCKDYVKVKNGQISTDAGVQAHSTHMPSTAHSRRAASCKLEGKLEAGRQAAS